MPMVTVEKDPLLWFMCPRCGGKSFAMVPNLRNALAYAEQHGGTFEFDLHFLDEESRRMMPSPNFESRPDQKTFFMLACSWRAKWRNFSLPLTFQAVRCFVRILAAADIHGALRVYEWIGEMAAEHRVNLLILAGDLFSCDSEDGQREQAQRIISVLKRTSVPCFYLMGNDDKSLTIDETMWLDNFYFP